MDPVPDAWRALLPPGADPSVLLIALWLNRLGRRFEVQLDALVRAEGLIPSEFRVLGTLLLNGEPHELSPTRLNEIVVLTSGGMTKAIRRLESLQLVERRADPSDGRGVLVRLTVPAFERARGCSPSWYRDSRSRSPPCRAPTASRSSTPSAPSSLPTVTPG